MAQSAPMFVVGIGRSGTSLLAHLLERHPKIHLDRDDSKGSFYRYQENLLVKYGIDGDAREYDTPDLCRQFVGTHPRIAKWWQDHPLDGRESLRETLGKVIADYTAGHGAEVMLIRSVNSIARLSTLSYLFPDLKVVHIIRDGRAVAVSQRARQDDNLDYAIHNWKRMMLLGRMDGAILGPGQYLEITFEQLLANPAETLEKVVSLAGLEFDDNMILETRSDGDEASDRYVLPFFDTTKATAWKGQLSAKEIRRLEEIAGDMLLTLGYELVQSNPNGHFRAIDPLGVARKLQSKYLRQLRKGDFMTRRGDDMVRVQISLRKRLSNFVRRSMRNYLHPRLTKQFGDRPTMVE